MCSGLNIYRLTRDQYKKALSDGWINIEKKMLKVVREKKRKIMRKYITRAGNKKGSKTIYDPTVDVSS